MNSNWFVCWNLGRKSGDPIRPRPDPPKYPSMVIPGRPPATTGLVTDPGMVAAAGVVDQVGGAEEIVRPRLVRQRHEPDDRGRDRIDPPCWNRVVGKRQPGERIADRGGENPGALVGRRHPGQARDAARDARAFE